MEQLLQKIDTRSLTILYDKKIRHTIDTYKNHPKLIQENTVLADSKTKQLDKTKTVPLTAKTSFWSSLDQRLTKTTFLFKTMFCFKTHQKTKTVQIVKQYVLL